MDDLVDRGVGVLDGDGGDARVAGDLASSMSSHSDLNSTDMETAPAITTDHIPSGNLNPQVRRRHDQTNELLVPVRRSPAQRKKAEGRWLERRRRRWGKGDGGRWTLNGGRRCLSTA